MGPGIVYENDLNIPSYPTILSTSWPCFGVSETEETEEADIRKAVITKSSTRQARNDEMETIFRRL